MTAGTIARIPCGANILCGDTQKVLAYVRGVGKKKKPISEADEAIGRRIKDARDSLDVSQEDLGVAFGKRRQTVQFWERGENFPPLSDFPKLCRLLRTDPNTLLGTQAMKALTQEEKIRAKAEIQALAREGKVRLPGVVRRRAAQERLHPRRAAAR